MDVCIWMYAYTYPLVAVQELGIMPLDEDGGSALKQAIIMFFAFIIFGFIPLFGMPACLFCVTSACIAFCLLYAKSLMHAESCTHSHAYSHMYIHSLAYVIFNPITWSGFNPTFLVATILTGVALFGLGAFKVNLLQ